MANCSTPNSTPATGRISTPWSRRLKKPSNRQSFCRGSCQLPAMGRQRLPLQARSTFFLNSAIRNARIAVRRCCGQGNPRFAIGRVKGAWWPSRSSKPSSPCKWRGRFDSYPLRHFKFEGRWLKFDFSLALGPFTSNLKHQTPNPQLCRVSKSVN
jgi:hypothetical protein